MVKRTAQELLEKAGKYIDKGFDTKNPQLTDKAFTVLDELSARKDMLDEEVALLHYFRANAFCNLQHEAGLSRSWDWEIAPLQSELLELRKAVRHVGFSDLHKIRQCQILTNLGNKLNSVGRPVEALHYWDRALAINGRFAMALFNRGEGLKNYALSVSEPGHAQLMLAQAHDSFLAGTVENAVHESEENMQLIPAFKEQARLIKEKINIKSANKNLAEEFSLGRSKKEQAYREWCLKKRLFLNPMNDLGAYTIAAQDVMGLPPITEAIDKGGSTPPPVFGFFNQLKQEYISARFFLYEGLETPNNHFADKDVKLINTLDYPSYSMNVEKVRASYRIAYSIFDKIAFFLNHYLELGIPQNKVYFRNIWYEQKGKEPKLLREFFKDRTNWSLRGLFWLSKDLFDLEFKDVTEPEAEALAELRNQLEHKYCQVHEQWSFFLTDIEDAKFKDNIGFHIGREDFEAKALRLMGLARAALIYLCLAVHREEKMKKNASVDTHIAPMIMDTLDDKWKM